MKNCKQITYIYIKEWVGNADNGYNALMPI